MLLAILLVVIVTGAGVLFYGVDIPTNTLPAFVVTLAVGAATFCTLGLAIMSVIPNANASPAIVNASILPLLFISDVFIPLDEAPAWLKILADIFPVRHFALALHTSFDPLQPGAGFEWVHLLIMAGWWVCGCAAVLQVGIPSIRHAHDLLPGLTTTAPILRFEIRHRHVIGGAKVYHVDGSTAGGRRIPWRYRHDGHASGIPGRDPP